MSVQVEEFDIGDEMKSAPVRTWMMKKDPEIDPGEFFTSNQNIQCLSLLKKNLIFQNILLDSQLNLCFSTFISKHVTGSV